MENDPLLINIYLFLFALFVVFVVIVASRIISPLLEEGEVIDKKYEPERTSFWVSATRGPIISRRNIIHYFDDADHILIIAKKARFGTRRGMIFVSEEIWDSVTIGDYYQKQEGDRLIDEHKILDDTFV